MLEVGYVILSHGGDMCKSSSQKCTIYTSVLVHACGVTIKVPAKRRGLHVNCNYLARNGRRELLRVCMEP